MAPAIYPVADQSASIVRNNMARMKLCPVAGPLLGRTAQVNRVVRILENRRARGLERPLVRWASDCGYRRCKKYRVAAY
jgi:hypothetical protein